MQRIKMKDLKEFRQNQEFVGKTKNNHDQIMDKKPEFNTEVIGDGDEKYSDLVGKVRQHIDQLVNGEELIDELVDADGGPIEGDRSPVSDSEIETAPGQTTDDFAQSAIQPNRYMFGVYGTPYSHGSASLGETANAKARLNKILREDKKK